MIPDINLSSLDEVTIGERQAKTSTLLLKNIVRDILNNKRRYDSYENAYKYVYKLAINRYGPEVYSQIQEVVVTYLNDKVSTELVHLSMPVFLEKLIITWKHYLTAIKLLERICMYLEIRFVNYHYDEEFITVFKRLFKEMVTLDSRMQLMQYHHLTALVEQTQRGSTIHNKTIREICDMLFSVGMGSREIYENIFESRFLRRSAYFYSLRGQELLENNSSMTYIHIAEDIISHESQIARTCLHPSSEPMIINMLEEVLIQNRVHKIIEKDDILWNLLERGKVCELKQMFSVLCRVPLGPKAMSEGLSKYIRCKGKIMIQELDCEGQTSYPDNQVYHSLQKIVDLLEFSENVIKNSFNDSANFKKVMSSDLEFVLSIASRSPEYLSIYLDFFLRKEASRVSEQKVGQVLSRTYQLFRYLESKDVFERIYRQHLARRLLLNKCPSTSWDKEFISKLKTECGNMFVQKLQIMIRDMEVSQQVDKEIRQDQLFLENIHEGFDFNIRVLNPWSWPLDEYQCDPYIPHDFRSAFEFYKLYYRGKYCNRKLSLHPLLGNAEICATFATTNTGEECILQVATNQLCLLLLFNINPRWTVKELQEETKYEIEELTSALHSLCVGKESECVLIKNPKNIVFEASHTLTVNPNFRPSKSRMKIQPAARAVKPKKMIITEIVVERKYEIQAAIMRVMKQHRSLPHLELEKLVVEKCATRFHPSSQDIRKGVVYLIDKDYMARSDEDSNVYVYLP